jgi:inner membrane protein
MTIKRVLQGGDVQEAITGIEELIELMEAALDTCQCPVLGVWQSGLIVLHDGKLRAVGEPQVHHNLHPTSAKLIEGEPLEVVSYKVDMRGKQLTWLLERIDR